MIRLTDYQSRRLQNAIELDTQKYESLSGKIPRKFQAEASLIWFEETGDLLDCKFAILLQKDSMYYLTTIVDET